MKLSIITLNFNKPELTKKCIASVYTHYADLFEKNEIELIIVDNHSEDNSVRILKEDIKKNIYKNIHIIESTINAGFGAGNNKGATYAKGEYLLFLNNDTAVQDKSLWNMVEYLNTHASCAILGGQLRNTDGSLQASIGSFYSLPKVLLLLLGLQRFGILDKSPKTIQRVDWVKGGLMMVRKEVFTKLSGFDEKIFIYTEDMELCFRARKLGYQTYFYPDVQVVHQEHGSTNRTFAIVHIYEGLLYFYKKHKPYWQLFLVQLLLQTKAYMLIALGRIIGNNYLVKTYGKALAVVR